ncbi:MAG: histidine phosphatase family protein [Acidobacteriota bacterium]
MIYLIRHARPVRSGVLLGLMDSPLAAEDLGSCGLNVQCLWTSPLQRARRTAELLFPALEPVIVPGLAERGLGEWEGMSWAEVKEHWPEDAARAVEDWFGFTPRGGEPWNEFVQRVKESWHNLPRDRATAIVAHAGVNAVLHSLATGSDVSSFQQDYGEVTEIAIPG